MTHEEVAQLSRDDFNRMSREVCDGLAVFLHGRMMAAFEGLTADDRAELVTPDHPYFLICALGSALGPEAIDSYFATDATDRVGKQVRRILARRFW